MRTLRGQFILSHVLPFVLILPLAGLVILYLAEAQIMLADLSANLEERAALIAEAVAQQPEVLTDGRAARQLIAEIGPLTDGQIYLLDADGALLAADSGLDTAPDPILVNEAEAASAVRVAVSYSLAGQAGEAVAPIIDVNEQIIGLVGVRESIAGLASSFSPLRRLVLFTILGGMALGALAGYSLARRLERPISRSAASIAGIAAGAGITAGNGRVDPLPSEGPRELRQLAESVNALAARLHSLEALRRRSFANIVHELGRPLGAVLAAVQVLRGSAGDDPAIRAELLDGVHKELTAMEPLLDDLSQLHADATGRLRLDRRPVALSGWLAAMLAPWRAAAIEKRLAWSADVPDNLPEIDIDPARMAQVVGNLLSNAVKYTTAGDELSVSAAADSTAVHIAIADTGPGIPSEEQALVFEPFYRGHDPRRVTEGLGVGLSIARSLTEAHGGRLTLESAPGRGSVFTITLPVKKKLQISQI